MTNVNLKNSTHLTDVRDYSQAWGRAEGRADKARLALTEAYKAAGEETPDLKQAVLHGHMMGTLGLNNEDMVRTIVAKKGFTSNAAAKARRTEKQEAAYTAARKALQRIRKAAGVEASDNRGKASKAPAPAAKAIAAANAAPKPAATMIPAFLSNIEMAAFLLAAGNKNAKLFTKGSGKALQQAIIAFAKDHNQT